MVTHFPAVQGEWRLSPRGNHTGGHPACVGSIVSGFLEEPQTLGAQTVKNVPAVQETRVQFLGQENHLEMAAHSNTLAWRIPWTEKAGGLYSSWGCRELDTTE